MHPFPTSPLRAVRVASLERSDWSEPEDVHGWGFGLLLLVTATVFLRPAELVPGLAGWPIYKMLISVCLLVSLRSVASQLTLNCLVQRPITACLLGLLLAVACSHLSHGFFWAARHSFWLYAKLLVFYLLTVGLINTPQRLQIFLRCLLAAIVAMATLALLDELQVLKLANIESIRDTHAGPSRPMGTAVQRLRGTGIFHDPNDLGLMLVSGIVLSTYFMVDAARSLSRYLWLIPLSILGWALSLTHSRGAFLSLLGAVAAWCHSRFGWRRMLLMTAFACPLLFWAFAGRMTQIDALQSGTGQLRIQIWSDALTLLRRWPLFGIGQGLLVEEMGVAAHNSYLHSFVELGAFGGVLFVGAILAALVGLRGGAKAALPSVDDSIRLRACVFALTAGYATGILSLSRLYVGPTYLILGLATATIVQTRTGDTGPLRKFDVTFLGTATAAAVALVGATYVFVQLFVRWS